MGVAVNLLVNPICLFALVPTWMTAWLTPLWLLSLGAALGLLVLFALWACMFAVSGRVGLAVGRCLREGVIVPILAVIGAVAAFSLIGWIVADNPRAYFTSIGRIPMVGRTSTRYEIEPAKTTEDGAVPAQAIDVDFRRDEIRSIVFWSDRKLAVTSHQDADLFSSVLRFEVGTEKSTPWMRQGRVAAPFPDLEVAQLFVHNESDRPANLTLDIVTSPPIPEVTIVPITAASVVGIVLLYLLMHAGTPKVAAIAHATSKSEMAQPVFPIVLVLGAFLLALFIIIPYHTFGEDIMMLKSSGFSLIMVLSIMLAIWSGSNSVAEEIEGRTALTVLSKPIGRRQFVVGKFLGIVWTVGVVFVVLGTFLLVIVSYKVVYDARESAAEAPRWFDCHREMVRTVPGLVLAFYEAVVMAALSVAISTRLPLIANVTICSTIYALGHLTQPIVDSSAGEFAPVAFMGQLIAIILPVLGTFNIPDTMTGRLIPPAYLGWSLLYCLLYSSIAMLLALTLFEDRDLA